MLQIPFLLHIFRPCPILNLFCIIVWMLQTFMAYPARKAGDIESSWTPGPTSGIQRSLIVHHTLTVLNVLYMRWTYRWTESVTRKTMLFSYRMNSYDQHCYLSATGLLVPYKLAGGGGLIVCSLSVCPSVCLSVSLSVTLQFSGVFSVVFWDIDLKFGLWTCHDKIQIKCEFRHAWPTFMGVIALY